MWWLINGHSRSISMLMKPTGWPSTATTTRTSASPTFLFMGSSSSSNGVYQRSDAFDFHFDFVAWLHGAGLARCPRIDDVAWKQRYILRDVTDDRIDREQHVAGSLRLNHFAIDAALNQQVVIVQASHDRRPERSEGIR